MDLIKQVNTYSPQFQYSQKIVDCFESNEVVWFFEINGEIIEVVLKENGELNE